MKKITLLFVLLAVSFGYSQAPTVDPTTPPARDAADVISIFSAAYSNVPGANYNPNWGQSGFATANSAYDTGSGNLVLAYPNFNHQGIEYATQNVSGMEFLHLDIWTDGGVAPNVYVISSGAEIPHAISNVAGAWQSIDLPISGLTGDPTVAFQFKFDGGNGTTSAIYVDNLYFWKNPADPNTDATLSDLQVDGTTISGFGSGTTEYTYEVPNGTVIIPQITTATPTQAGLGATASITQASAIPGDATVLVTAPNGTDTELYTVSIVAVGPPAAAPTPPARAAGDVISLYSDQYTDVSSNFDAGWCGGSSVSEVMIDGNATQKYLNNACQGIVLDAGVDASTFTNLHVDAYIQAGTDLTSSVFNLKFVNQPGGAALEINLNVASTPALVAGSWMSIDIVVDLSTFTGFKEFGITSNLNNLVWYDNLYVHKDTVLGVNDFEISGLKVYPNPTNNVWNVKTKDQIIKTVQVFDVLGKQVLNMNPNKSDVTIDASTLPKGLYFAKLTTEIGSNSVKLIKN